MSSRFDPEFYAQYRPFYPAVTFSGFVDGLIQKGFHAPFVIVDIGCGTGHSAQSLLDAGIDARIIGVDPDPEMLKRAVEFTVSEKRINYAIGKGEATGLAPGSVDGIIVGSAFHWLDFVATKREFTRILRPQGLVRIFEYQFPKASQHPEFNEWIRREFNLRWKAPDQKPRGSLKELTSGFTHDSMFVRTGEGRPKMQLTLDVDQITGLLLSQSRVLHYVDTLTADARKLFYGATRDTIRGYLGEEALPFDFRLAWIEFRRQ